MYPSKAIQAAAAVLFQRRQEAQQRAMDRRNEIYELHPQFRTFDQRIQGLAKGIAMAALSPDGPEQVEKIMNEIKAIQEEKRALCRQLGLPEDVFEPRYTCPICQDTGSVDGKRCQCMEALIRAESCRGLPAAALEGSCTFQSFDLSYYPTQPDKNGKSPRAVMAGILQRCREYADSFGPGSGSLLFLGKTGLGKTHLSLAIAGQVARQGFGVLYSSTQGIVDRSERVRFDRGATQEDRDFVQMAPRCDLLVIDDLGAEFSTAFSQSVLYNILNDRITAALPTIISTNLTPDQIAASYSDRIASRILCGSTIYGFTGKDIRLEKQFRSRGGAAPTGG
jgi:DNA replication protein DnaC